MEAPVLDKTIPTQVVNEQAAYGPFNLKDFIRAEGPLRFSAELKDGQALPKGMICTEDGVLTGIPAKNTAGNYELNIHVENAAGAFTTTLMLIIKPALTESSSDYLNELKAQIWEALEKKLPVPDLSELYDRPISLMDICYLLERWGILTIWDAFNLEPAGEKKRLKLEGASEHYHVYDRGSCLVAAPKDLFSHERTIEDGLRTARAMAREVYKRAWTVELSGIPKLSRAAWVEIQHLGDKYGKTLEVINFNPTLDDIKLYKFSQISEEQPRSSME